LVYLHCKQHKNNMYLFFDTETSGLPKNPQLSHTEVDNWPRLVQIAWVLFSKNLI
jgi:DNA polymerase III epsilon subunit-like protein